MVTKKPAAASKKFQYQLITGPTITPSYGPGGASIGVLYINRKEKPLLRAVYSVFGAGVGLSKAKIAIFQAFSDPSDFESTVSGIDQFRGTVDMIETSAQAIVGFGWQGWYWKDGPASGTKCEGTGGQAGLAIGVNVCSMTRLILAFQGIQDGTYKQPPGEYKIPARGPK